MPFAQITQTTGNINTLGLNVQNFGAQTNNLSFDSSPAFNAGLQAAFAQNAPLLVPPGSYRWNSTVNVPGSVTMLGLGSEQQTIFFCGGIIGTVLKSINPASFFTGCRFEHFRIDCEASATPVNGFDISGMASTRITDVRVANATTNNFIGFRADNSVGFSNSLSMIDCITNNLTNGRGFHINNAGTVGYGLYGQFNRESFFFAGTESSYVNLRTSDNAGSTVGAALTLQNSNRTNVSGFVSDDSSRLSVVLNGATNCNLSNFHLMDNNQSIQGGANGGFLYVSGSQNCHITNFDIEIVFATPVAGTYLVNWDNGSSGANINNHLTNLRANGNNRANTYGLRVPSVALGVDNKFVNCDFSRCANVDPLLETQGKFGFVNSTSVVGTNTGTAQINAAGTSVVVNHGLMAAPQRVIVSPTSDSGVAIRYWVSTRTATQFTINCSPATTNALTFDWRAIAYEEQ